MYFGRLLAIFVGFIVFLVLLLVILSHGHKKPVVVNPIKPLPDYAETDASVSFTVDGIVNGDEMHRSIRITISANQREVDVLQGYNPQVIQNKTFLNNQEAYTVFLKAINNYGFLAKSKNLRIPASESGQCPLGFRYVLDLNQDGDDLVRTWASTCGQTVGDSKAAISVIQQLFQNQIPSYNSLVGNVNLSATTDQ
jgi:hypothetical protein